MRQYRCMAHHRVSASVTNPNNLISWCWNNFRWIYSPFSSVTPRIHQRHHFKTCCSHFIHRCAWKTNYSVDFSIKYHNSVLLFWYWPYSIAHTYLVHTQLWWVVPIVICILYSLYLSFISGLGMSKLVTFNIIGKK